jgi:hypothetical protein
LNRGIDIVEKYDEFRGWCRTRLPVVQQKGKVPEGANWIENGANNN